MVEELLMDGTVEEKAFAPGYGEFQSKAEDELATVALALPIDRVGGTSPAGLAVLADGARAVAGGRGPGRGHERGLEAGRRKRRARAPGRADDGALEALGTAVRNRDQAGVHRAAPAVEQASLDLQGLWNRTAHSAGPAAARRVEAALKSLATVAARQDTRAAAAAAPAVRQALSAIAP
jgi:hypothetical protein